MKNALLTMPTICRHISNAITTAEGANSLTINGNEPAAGWGLRNQVDSQHFYIYASTDTQVSRILMALVQICESGMSG